MKTDKNFKGFTIPDGAWLPPEMIDLLPDLDKSHLKVLIVIIYNHVQLGGNSPTSIRDLTYLTGLAKQSVITALNQLLEAGLILREELGQSFIYEPQVQNLDHQVRLSKDRGLNLDDSPLLDSSKLGVLKTLRSCGLYAKTARKVADEFEVEVIERHIRHYEYAVNKKWAQGPGWLVLSIKENWGPPIGYKASWDNPAKSSPAARRRYADWDTNDTLHE